MIRKLCFALLGLVLGGALGGGAGLLGGLLYTGLAGTRSFEGYSGYVVIYWIAAGLLLGLMTGAVMCWRFGRPGRQDPSE